jgi:hypothetical protein
MDLRSLMEAIDLRRLRYWMNAVEGAARQKAKSCEGGQNRAGGVLQLCRRTMSHVVGRKKYILTQRLENTKIKNTHIGEVNLGTIFMKLGA